MRSTTLLDSAIFHLTPTRTRYDLLITANGKKEKIASGLLDPFLAHLKTAQDQIGKGGYSILLEPEQGTDAMWFTKGTVDRFVRFVSTPEILERVYTTESEILQIEKAIAIQGNNDIGLSTIEDHRTKAVIRHEGNKLTPEVNEEKAMVLYKPGTHPHEADGSIAPEGNSKVQLLKVLETRKTMLQKEQGMAFARAVAAGFDMDHMTPLVSFAKCFGASRLMEACLKFMDLWTRKHESGQWLAIEAAEAQNESHIGLASEINGKAGIDTSAGESPPVDHQIPVGQQEYFPGQFPHPTYAPWPIHSPPGTVPGFQPYPMQGMPYYQNYSGNGPFYSPPYPPVGDSRLSAGQRTGQKRHSMGHTGSEMCETDTSKIRSLDDMELEKKAGRSGRKQSGKVVIRNINYITSKKQISSGSESESASDSEADINVSRSSKRKGNQAKSIDETNPHDNEATLTRKERDGGHWLAFQNCLLRGTNEDNRATGEGMFESEKGVQMKRRQTTVSGDPIILREEDRRGNGRGPTGDTQFTEINGKKVLYKMNANDDFMIGGQENQSNLNSSDPLAVNGFEDLTNKFDRTSLRDMADESFVVPFRSMSLGQVGTSVNMHSEFPSTGQDSENISNRVGGQANYEPDDLSFMPERKLEKRPTGYDPALDYEMQFPAEGAASLDKRNKEVTGAKQGYKNSDKDRRSKGIQDNLDKKTGGPIRKGKPSKMSPLEEARARAEKLRTYKSDLQKMKKEKEEADKKRLEALKMERQKRIAARGSSTAAQSPIPSLQTRKKLPTKLSPVPRRGSKFSDSEPGSSSPLQRSKIRTTSLGSSDSHKASKISKSSESRLMGNRLARSVSSLSDPKKETNGVTPESKASMARIRRLSEPKTVLKPKVSDGPVSKKISAIINLDRSKAATLPELKVKTPKISPTIGQKKSASKEKLLKANGGKPQVTSESGGFIANGKISNQGHVDDKPVIEKTVVMLEYEKPSIPTSHASDKKVEVRKGHYGNFDTGEKIEVVSEYAAIHAQPSPTDGVNREHIPSRLQEHPVSREVISYPEKKSPKFSSISIAETPYQAPYARVSSKEGLSTRNPEYGKAPQTSLVMAPTYVEPKAHVSELKNQKLEKIPEALEKPQVKESSKGFRRLLKLGRRNASNSEQDDNVASSASSTEVNTLKNLISQDETSTAGNSSQKSSRHFSLLSPFRSKTSEKKMIT